MELNKIFIQVTAICLVSMFIMGEAQNTPADYKRAHNEVRAEVGVGPVRWNRTVAAFARKYAQVRANDCAMEHSMGPDYAENIAEGDETLTGYAAVKYWATEKPDYDYNTNSCSKGEDECGHYVQIVWRKTTEIGCARVRCNNGRYFVTCNYYPPGGYEDEKPY